MANKSNEDKAARTDATGMSDAVEMFQKVGLGPMSALGTAMIENISRWNTEVAEFVANRIRQDVETQQRIINCRDMDELREIQTQFIKTAMEQYTAETGKLVQMGNEMMASTMRKSSD